ncbi:MAG: thioesterase family protein [Deltaproteobacteria bacterium]|nr:thioesterase family protein [Deltaproteobacteria bacterium]
MTSWTQVRRSLEIRGGSASAVFPEAWAQGRASFGGLIVALALDVMRSLVEEKDRRLRSLLTQFAGPVAPGAARIAAQLVRSGRAATHLRASIEQEGQVAASVLASFVADRSSAIVMPGAPPPPIPPIEALPDVRYVPGVTPAFTQHFEYRWAFGDPPYSGSQRAELGGLVRFREAGVSSDEGSLLALVDAWPPPVIPRLKAPAPASSVTWSIEFLEIDPAESASAWWLYRGETLAALGGQVSARAWLWSPSGRLAAVSTQHAAVFDAR